MLFSLVVPVYNTKDYLAKCLSSIEAQDFPDYELILVDDGSDDGSEDICDEFCKGKTNCKVIHQTNTGLAGARNRGIKEAKGDWIWFIDSDDFIVSNALSTLHERMRKAHGDVYVFQYYRTDENGENREEIYFRDTQLIVPLDEEKLFLSNLDERLLQYKDSWESTTRLLKRSIINEHQLEFKDTGKVFAEDLCFVIEYMMYCTSQVMLVNHLYCYRMRNTSIMNSLDQKTVMPRLLNLLEDNYKEAQKANKRQTVKHFEIICFGVIRTHIKKMTALSDDELRSEISSGTERKLIGKYIKKIKNQLFTEIENRQSNT